MSAHAARQASRFRITWARRAVQVAALLLFASPLLMAGWGLLGLGTGGDDAVATPAELPFESVELYALTYETTERLRQAAESHQVSIELEGAPITVRGVRQMLSEAVYNLCDNAIKYNHPGGKVHVSVNASPEGARLAVSDNGIGIAPADQAHVFERFYRADKSHSKTVGGTGLGLAIVKHVCELHGASVKVESVSGQGTSFLLTFPLPDA